MNATFVKALAALVPVSMLFCGSVVRFFRTKSAASFLQPLGAGCLAVVVLTHVAEGLQWFPSMHWGEEQSIGHYLDLSAAVLGVTLFPVGYFFEALRSREATRG